MLNRASLRANANYLVAAILLAALIGVGYSVYRLQNIFLAENQRSRLLLEERRDYIENAAKQLLADSLQQKIDAAIPAMQELVENPYLHSAGYYWSSDGKQILPLNWRFTELPHDSAIKHYQHLHSVVAEEKIDPEWHEDLTLLWRFANAVLAQDERVVESTARAVMIYDANHRFASRHELVYRLVFAEILASYPLTSRELLVKLIREDLRDDQGAALSALQKELLWRRGDLSREEFEFLKDKIVSLSKRRQVRSDDFYQVASPASHQKLVFPVQAVRQPVLWRDSWYLEQRDDNVYGVAIDMTTITQNIIASLTAQDWLNVGDSLVLLSEGQLQPLAEVGFQWYSPQFQQNLAELQAFYRLKQLTLFAGVLSLVAAGFLMWWLYRSQARWIGIKSEFVATVAHEMRTPLSSIRLMAERLADTLQGERAGKDYPRRILADIDTLSFLSENILSFERLQSGKWITHTSPVALQEVVAYLQKELPLFVRQPFILQSEGDDDVVIQADPTLIKLLFLNLGKNSCTYNTRAQANLTVKWYRRQQALCVDFVDNGTGIKPEEWQDSFAPFYRGKNQRHTRGSGLGLALCRKIMTLHNGQIDIIASDEQGTHFRLVFPDK